MSYMPFNNTQQCNICIRTMNLFVNYKYFCILKLSAEVKISFYKVHNKRSLVNRQRVSWLNVFTVFDI